LSKGDGNLLPASTTFGEKKMRMQLTSKGAEHLCMDHKDHKESHRESVWTAAGIPQCGSHAAFIQKFFQSGVAAALCHAGAKPTFDHGCANRKKTLSSIPMGIDIRLVAPEPGIVTQFVPSPTSIMLVCTCNSQPMFSAGHEN
jgi:hypothetical protein